MRQDIPKLLREYLPNVEEIFKKRTEQPELRLLTLNSINKITWGIPKKKMTIIAGRTSHGKSNMALNLAYDFAKQKHPVLFLSLEMPSESLVERIFCYDKKVDNAEIMRGKFYKHKNSFEEFKQDIETANIPFVLGDMLGRTIEDIDQYLTSLDHKPEAVFIDHLQEISTTGKDDRQSIDKYLRHMRELAIRDNFALVCCSQINRLSQSDDDKRPKLHQLKSSGSIEEMADLVFLLFWEYHHDKTKNINHFELNVAKNRDGMTGYVDLIYYPEYCRFEDKPSDLK